MHFRHPLEHRRDRAHPAQLRNRAAHPTATSPLSAVRLNRMPAVVEAHAQSRGALSGKVAVVFGGAKGVGPTGGNHPSASGASRLFAALASQALVTTGC